MFKIQQVRITKGDFLVMHLFSQSDDHVNAKCNKCMNACRMHVDASFCPSYLFRFNFYETLGRFMSRFEFGP